MKLTEVMSTENVATLRSLFARCSNDLKGMNMHDRVYAPTGIYALNTYNTLLWFMIDVRDAYSKKYIVIYVLNNLNTAWNMREKMSKRYIETGDEKTLARFKAYTIQVITLQMILSYVIR